MEKCKTIPVEDNYTVIGRVSIDDYYETVSAEPTSRMIEGSRDHGYFIEYTGEGKVKLDGKEVNVTAVYLFEEDEYKNDMEAYDGDEGSLDWTGALKRFEIRD